MANQWSTADYALIISLCSLALALASFVWNVWSKFIYPKPRLDPRIGYYVGVTPAGSKKEGYILLSVTNHGPSEACIKLIIGRKFRWHSWLSRRFDMLIIKHWGHSQVRLPPIELPAKLEIGQEKSFAFDPSVNWFDEEKRIQVGVVDTFGKNHWVSRSSMTQLQNSLKGRDK